MNGAEGDSGPVQSTAQQSELTQSKAKEVAETSPLPDRVDATPVEGGESSSEDEKRMSKTQASIRPSIWKRYRDEFESIGTTNPYDSTTLSAFVRLDLEKYNEGIQEEDLDRPIYWIIVFAAFLVHFIADGIGFSFGVILQSIEKEFDENKGKSSMAGAVLQSVPLLVFPVSGALSERVGFRLVVVVGGLLAGTFFAVSSRVTNINVLFVTFGLMPGVGLGFCYHSAIVIVSLCFRKRKGIAMGVTVCGSAVGTIAMAPLISKLIESFGWKGSTLILAGILFQLVVCGAIMQTPKRIREVSQRGSPKSKGGSEEGIHLESTIISLLRIARADTCFLITHPDLLTFVLSNLVLYAFYGIPYNIGPDLYRSQGESSSRAALLVSVLGATNLFGMIFFGFLIDWLEKREVSKTILILIQGVSEMICGVMCISLPFSRPYPLLVFLNATFGFFIAASYVNTHEVVADMVPAKNITFFFGITCFFQGIGSFLGTPIAGLMYDRTQAYTLTFTSAGAGVILAGLLVCLSAVFRSRRVRRTKAQPGNREPSQDTLDDTQPTPPSMDPAEEPMLETLKATKKDC